MTSRPAEWPPKPGSPVWVDGLYSRRSMPPGVERFQRMTYMGLAPGDNTHAVLVDDQGREFLFTHEQYEHPQVWRVGNEWIHESNPRAQQAIRDFIERMKLEGPKSYSGAAGAHADTILRLEHVLRRNGVEP